VENDESRTQVREPGFPRTRWSKYAAKGFSATVAASAAAVALVTFAPRATAAQTSLSSAETQCANGHSLTKKLTLADEGFLKRFIPCAFLKMPSVGPSVPYTSVVGDKEADRHLFGQSKLYTRSITPVFDSFASGSAKDDKSHFIDPKIDAALTAIDHAYPKADDEGAPDSSYAYRFGDTTPTAPTAAVVASQVQTAWKYVLKTQKEESGVALDYVVNKGAGWFHDANGNAWLRYAFVEVPTGV
jgi:hypothetical protein